MQMVSSGDNIIYIKCQNPVFLEKIKKKHFKMSSAEILHAKH